MNNRFLATLCLIFFSTSSYSEPLGRKELEGVRVVEHLGDSVDLNTELVDENGQIVTFKDYMKDGPLVVMFGYLECPKLCSLVANGFFGAARNLTWSLGKEYNFVMISIDPKEDHILAANKKVNYVRYYGRNDSEKGIHFLTGKEANIRKLADEIGFQYRYDEKAKQYVHPAVLTVLSSKGKFTKDESKGMITRYLYGIDFQSNDLKLALLEAAEGRIGNIVERILLLCYQFDPNAGSYSIAIMSMMKIAAVCTMLMIAFLILFLRRQTRKTKNVISVNTSS